MEGLPVVWIVFVIIGWVVSAISKAQKKQQNQAAQNAQATQRQAVSSQPVQARNQFGSQGSSLRSAGQAVRQPAIPAKQVSPFKAAAAAPAHRAEPLKAHIHEPVMGVEGAGTEGIDCCHEYMLTSHEEEETPNLLSLNEEDQADRSRALLQGVIFSEILGRRQAKRYGRRSA